MKTITTIVGIIFIILGIVALSYDKISYTKQEKVAEIGNIQVTAEKEETLSFPPILGGASIAVGIVLVIIGRIGKK